MVIERKKIWYLGLVVYFCIALNPDWRVSSLVWWGCIGFLAVTYIFAKRAKVPRMLDSFIAWWLIFTIVAAVSILYAVERNLVAEYLKTMVVFLVAFYMIRSSLNTKEEIINVVTTFVVAVAIIALYLVTQVDVRLFVLERVGKADTGSWNSNTVGILMAVAIVFILYLFTVWKSALARITLALFIALFGYLVIITASRKAIIMLIMGICGYRILLHPTKVVRNILLTVCVLALAYWAVMEIPALYDLIGWRIEGMIASFTGVGVVDTSSAARKIMRQDALQAFLKEPLLGYGIDNFQTANSVRRTYAHNNFLEVAADLGVIGLIAYYWIYIRIIYGYLKNRRSDPLYAVLFISFLMFLTSHYALVVMTDLTQILVICFSSAYLLILKKEQSVLKY